MINSKFSVFPSASRRMAMIASPSSKIHRLVIVRAAKGFGPSKPSVVVGCPCGTNASVPYKECCEPLHQGAKQPDSPEQLLRSRFSAFSKGEEEYIVSTFHPSYLTFKYPGYEGDAGAQLKRDVAMACSTYSYSKLKVLDVSPGKDADEAFIRFRYESTKKSSEGRTGSRNMRVKAAQAERNMDGSVKVTHTEERSRFLRDPSRGWLFVDYELIAFPEHMAEAKEAELKSRGQT